MLWQMDGFDQTVNVKVIMATNRVDTLTLHFFVLLDFIVYTAKMNLSDEVDLEDVSRPDKISVAQIAAICQEAGLRAVRKKRYVILPKDFEKGYRSNVKKQALILNSRRDGVWGTCSTIVLPLVEFE
ncbi:26S proteasome regulatory subunitB [Sesamum angolense]|uniref:26S proteasome regulatory subunitB n=1 Tax=Sesamum angolense TaxID=2727404 RepID=A0AAE1WMN3_9LAMI|nr:26S proteasome regulatory subunitB [Sesamum angolense]